MSNNKLQRKAIFVSPFTHQAFKELAVKEKMTFELMLKKLILIHKGKVLPR